MHLERPPLVQVIAQVRFPPILALGRQESVAPFQEAIRRRYPILRPESVPERLLLGVDGPVVQPSTMLWRFHDKDDVWRVALTTNSISLQANKYSSRADFFERLHQLLDELVRVTDPVAAGYERFGIRYVNRVRHPELEHLSRMVQPEVLGVANIGFGPELIFSVCESSFAVDDAQLRARWGLLPPRATTDPTAIREIDESSWILDLDMFVEKQPEFDASVVVERGQRFAETIYAFFRWCVTDEFLRTYGGQV
ncbi:TIGR04255 family protein [Polyangium spumosum]|uniref:TIGR04255 family protein n=1 Tax=Polyangium spumosum TaxID=889282 RepID=UPI003083FF47